MLLQIAEQAAFLRVWLAVVQAAIDRGWTLEEAVARVSLLHRYPMEPGLDDMGPEVQRRNVAHLYKLLSARGVNYGVTG